MVLNAGEKYNSGSGKKDTKQLGSVINTYMHVGYLRVRYRETRYFFRGVEDEPPLRNPWPIPWHEYLEYYNKFKETQ